MLRICILDPRYVHALTISEFWVIRICIRDPSNELALIFFRNVGNVWSHILDHCNELALIISKFGNVTDLHSRSS